MKSVESTIEDNLKLIESMAEKGCTDKEIAEKIGVSYSTFKKYKTENKALKDLMAECKNKKNEEVEQALFNNCIGYHYKEDVAIKVKYQEKDCIDGKEVVLNKERIDVVTVERYQNPDLNAQKYWLNNQKKSKWSDDPNKVNNDKKLTKLKEKELEIKKESSGVW